jgi:SAM-dependent methyltransferase
MAFVRGFEILVSLLYLISDQAFAGKLFSNILLQNNCAELFQIVDRSAVGNYVKIKGNPEKNFFLSNRDARGHREEGLPHSWFVMKELNGKIVVDVGSGPKQTWVNQLRRKSIEAYGVDPTMEEREIKKGFGVRSEIVELPLKTGSVDFLYSLNALFSDQSEYFSKQTDNYLIRSLKEIDRVLKTDGVARLGPFFSEHSYYRLNRLISSVPGLKLRIVQGSYGSMGRSANDSYAVELFKDKN